MKELGFDYPVPVPFILLGPKGLPEPIRGKLEEIFTTAAKDPEYVKGVTDIRLLATYHSSGETARYMRTNFDRVGEMLRKAGLKK
jgi:tripartite-type tricarboxylate transporter receptor subunit TctC